MPIRGLPIIGMSTLFLCFLLIPDIPPSANSVSAKIGQTSHPIDGSIAVDKREIEKDQPATLTQASPQAAYILMLRNKTPRLNAGETVEVEIYLSGYGMPERNKLYIQWSSDAVLDSKHPGVIQAWIGSGIHKTSKQHGPIKKDKPAEVSIRDKPDSGGLTFIFAKQNFLRPFQVDEPKSHEVERIAAEFMWDDKPPVLLKLNTASNAPSGDYEIAFTFTYGNAQGLFQDYRTVSFRIRDWQERNPWAVPSAFIIAFLSLLITAFGAVYPIFCPANPRAKNPKKGK